MNNSGDKHVIVWAGAHADGSSLWFDCILKATSNNNPASVGFHVLRTPRFSDAHVFDSFEEAKEAYELPVMKEERGGKMFIRYYSDKDYFKEVLARG